MQTTNVIESVFGSPGRIRVLRALAKAPRPVSGRQVAQLSGLTHRGAIQALAGLVETGVVVKRQVGRAHQYELARENVITSDIVLRVLEAEERVKDRLLTRLVQEFSPYAQSLVLFGSRARGEAGPSSDVDLLVVVEADEGKALVEDLANSVGPAFLTRFGCPLSVHTVAVTELRKSRAPYLGEARREGLLLFGKPLEELSKRGA